ncbi:MAG: hypothetical protein RL021_1684, partial [Bacteroidota bacterium]
MTSGRIACCFLFNLATIGLKAADDSPAFGISGRIGYGFLMAHREALVPMQESHIVTGEISFFLPTTGDQKWERDFLLPEKGVQLEAFHTGTEKLGTAVAVYPFMDFPLNGSSTRTLWLRYGIGLGYISRTFDRLENYKNAAVGSHLNGVLHIDLQYRGRLGENSCVDFGIGLTHFSNGSTRMPNLGVNFPKATIGYRYFFGEKSAEKPVDRTPEPKAACWQVYAAGSVKETYPVLGEKYTAATIDAAYFPATNRRSRLGFGCDVFYDASLSVRYERLYGDSRKAADVRPGIYGAWEMRLGALGIGFNLGFYPYTIYKEDGLLYHRIG